MSLLAKDVFRTRPKRRTPEKDIQRAIVRLLSAHGWVVAVTDAGQAYVAGAWGGSRLPTGWPDLVALGPCGRVLLIECKAPKGRQSVEQQAMQAWCAAHGHVYVLARGVDDILQKLAAMERLK